MGVVSLADVKKQLGIAADDTSGDAELQGYIDAATTPIEDQLGQAVEQRTFTDRLTLPSGGVRHFLLETVPVVSLTSVVSVDGTTTWDVSSLDADGPSGEVTVVSGPLVCGQVDATYVAGLSTVQPNVRLAGLIIIQHLWETQRGAMGVQLGGENEPWIPGRGFAIPRRALELLGPPLPGVA